MAERKLNLKDLNLKHVEGEIYEFEGLKIDMTGCGRTHFQMMRHIARELANRIPKMDYNLFSYKEECRLLRDYIKDINKEYEFNEFCQLVHDETSD